MSRTKTVFSNSEIVHAWAHGTADHGRTPVRAHRDDWRSSYADAEKVVSMEFNHGVIYSYGDHYPMAKRIVDLDYSNVELIEHTWTGGNGLATTSTSGHTAYLVNNASSTVTTEKHKGDVRRAIPSNVLVFNVPWLTDKQLSDAHKIELATTRSMRDQTLHALNLADYITRIEALRNPAARERKGLKARRIRQFICLASEMYAYAKVFGIDVSMLPIDINQAMADLQTALPAEQEYESGLAAKRNAKNADRNAAWQAQRELDQLSDQERADKWRQGGPLSRSFTLNGQAILRLKGNEVETSQGASFPVVHAIKAIQLLNKIVDTDKTGVIWQANGHSIPLGHYQIEQVQKTDNDVVILAGCHKVSMNEVHRLEMEIANTK